MPLRAGGELREAIETLNRELVQQSSQWLYEPQGFGGRGAMRERTFVLPGYEVDFATALTLPGMAHRELPPSLQLAAERVASALLRRMPRERAATLTLGGWQLSVAGARTRRGRHFDNPALGACIITLTLDGSGSVTLFHSDGAVTVGEQAAMDYYAIFGPDLKPATHAVTAGSAGRVSITFRFVETRGGAGGSCSSDVPPPSRNSPHRCNHHLRTDVTTISAPM